MIPIGLSAAVCLSYKYFTELIRIHCISAGTTSHPVCYPCCHLKTFLHLDQTLFHFQIPSADRITITPYSLHLNMTFLTTAGCIQRLHTVFSLSLRGKNISAPLKAVTWHNPRRQISDCILLRIEMIIMTHTHTLSADIPPFPLPPLVICFIASIWPLIPCCRYG